MAEQNPELRAAIDAAKARIEVASYFPKALNNGVKGNAQGFWSGTVLGFATGGLAGGLISLGLVAASITSPLIGLPLILGVAGIGGTAGGVNGARIGAGSGAIAGVAAERERRDKAEKLEQEILASPEKQREAIEAYRKNPVVEKDDTAEETVATSTSAGNALHKFVDGKTILAAMAICSLVSIALFAGTFMLAGGTAAVAAAAVHGVVAPGFVSGFGALGMTSWASVLGIGAGAGAAMGAAFGIAYPPIFASIAQHTGDLLSGKTMHGQNSFGHIKTAAEMQVEAAQYATQNPSSPATRSIALNETPAGQIHAAQYADRVAAANKQVAI